MMEATPRHHTLLWVTIQHCQETQFVDWGPISCNIPYLIFQDKNEDIVSAKEVIDDLKATFTVSIPKEELVHNIEEDQE